MFVCQNPIEMNFQLHCTFVSVVYINKTFVDLIRQTMSMEKVG